MDRGMSNTNKLLLFCIFIIVIYLMFFNFNMERAFDYTVEQVSDFINMFTER
jgi:hypothetical protein